MYILPIEFATPEYDESVHLRDEVLRKPLNLSFTTEQLSEEYQDTHLACYSPTSELLGILILSNITNDPTTLKMRQVAVAAAAQGQGVGTMLVAASEAWAKEKAVQRIVLNARDTAIPFYQKLNYQTVGEEFTEVGIPHRKMEKFLK